MSVSARIFRCWGLPIRDSGFEASWNGWGLREDALYKGKQEQEARQIQAYEAELRDSTEFHAWQTEMRSRDAERSRKNVERTRVLAKASAVAPRVVMLPAGPRADQAPAPH